MGALALVILLALSVGSALAGEPPTRQDWDRADAETVRLKPAVFSELSAEVRRDLERRGCLVPQTLSSKAPHNVIRGRFTSAAQTDIAVLCSRGRVSSILVYRGGSAATVAELAGRPEAEFLQVAAGGVIEYSRILKVADPPYIRRHAKGDGGAKSPSPDHDGINDVFAGKASVVWYWHDGRWLQLQGAD